VQPNQPVSRAGDGAAEPETRDRPLSPNSPDQTEDMSPEALALAQKRSSEEIEPLAPSASPEGPVLVRAIKDEPPALGRPQVRGCEVLVRLGAGTFGEVWKAREEGTGITVAVKFFHRGAGQEWGMLQAEVKQLAELDAVPGIVHLKSVEPAALPPYYVMVFAEGGSLADRLQKGVLPLAEAVAVFRQVCAAMAYVHVKGIRHCDLKPGNILLDARGCALVGDFGQAHFSHDASPALGTFFYMAPEQADLARQVPDARWDVYGLGALLYVMLTGRPPRDDERFRESLSRSTDLPDRLKLYREWVKTAPRPDGHRRVAGMDRELAQLIDRCLEVDPERRFRDAGAVLAALEQRERRRRQRPLVLFGMFAPVVLLLCMAGLAIWGAESFVAQCQESLVARLEKSDQYTARLIATVLERELDERKEAIETFARQKEVRAALAAGDRAALHRLLASEAAGKAAGLFHHWAAVDADGHVLALDRQTDRPISTKSFRRQDWFHGGSRHLPEGTAGADGGPPGPVTQTHISQPYVSTLRDKGAPEGTLMIGISTPVFADPEAEGARPVGLLLGAIPLDDLYGWLSASHMQQGFTVLLDRGGHCLLHQLMSSIRPAANQDARDWREVCPFYRQLLDEERMEPAKYQDPVNGKTYYASPAPLKDKVGWVVVVQHDQEAALQPVSDLRHKLQLLGVGALAVLGGTILILWTWLYRTLRRMEDRAHG
jgi:hypothetical protein